jgi:hypothetical protein
MEAWARELELVRCGKQAPVQRISYVFCYIELSPVFSLFALNTIQKKKQRVRSLCSHSISYNADRIQIWYFRYLDFFPVGYFYDWKGVIHVGSWFDDAFYFDPCIFFDCSGVWEF